MGTLRAATQKYANQGKTIWHLETQCTFSSPHHFTSTPLAGSNLLRRFYLPKVPDLSRTIKANAKPYFAFALIIYKE